MSRLVSRIKRAGQSIRDGDSYERFGEYPRSSERETDRSHYDYDTPIQDLGAMVMGTGAAITVMGTAVELTGILQGELASLPIYAGLGGIAIGGVVYAIGKTSE